MVISESTRQLMRGAYQVRRLAPLTVKGKVSPLVAYLVEGQPVSRPPARYPGGSVFETRMVARDVEVVMV